MGFERMDSRCFWHPFDEMSTRLIFLVVVAAVGLVVLDPTVFSATNVLKELGCQVQGLQSLMSKLDCSLYLVVVLVVLVLGWKDHQRLGVAWSWLLLLWILQLVAFQLELCCCLQFLQTF